jgi:hypothetical protein
MLIMLVSSTTDPTAAGLDPDHGHIVVGGSALDRARALAWHIRYGHEEDVAARVPGVPHDGDEKDGAEDDGARVVSIHGGAAVTVLDSFGSVILTMGWSFTPPAPPQGRAARPSSARAIQSDLLVPQPPPRAS